MNNNTEWFKSAEKKATALDGDCEGYIWTWQEYFSEDPETMEIKSVGFFTRRKYWADCSAGRYRDGLSPPMWAHSDLRQHSSPDGIKEGCEDKRYAKLI